MADMTLFEAIASRRSVRSYAPVRLDQATVRRLLDAAVLAPTAVHEEAWAFAVVQDPALLKRISDRAKALVLAGPESGRFERMASDPEFNVFYDASTLIVICARPATGFVTADCWLAAENLMLAATALGLGTCCIGLAVQALNEAAVKADLGIPPEASAVAPIIVGMPRGQAPPVPRKPPVVLGWAR